MWDRARDVLTTAIAFHTELIIEKAEGVYVWDTSGRKYMDFSSGVATLNIGHCHRDVVTAIKGQCSWLLHGGGVYLHEPLVRLGETLKDVTPGELNSFFFGNSGTEVVEGSIKLARHVTRRQGIIAFTGSFHGRSLGSLSLTSSTARYRKHYHPLLPSVYHAPFPYCYRCIFKHEMGKCDMECLEYLSHVFSYLIDPEEVAAIIIEPVLGEGGYIPLPDGFLQRLRKLCNEYGIMLILDEVQTGFGRTGKWFASEHYGIVPDIMAMAKAIASGMPLGAVASTKPIMDMWPKGAHGTTFGGNPLSCAAAIATITVLKRDGIIERAAYLGRMSMERLNALKDRYESIGDVRGRGLMIGIEFVKADKSPDRDLAMKIVKKCAERGLILIECGWNKNILRFIPPLIVEESEISRALDIFEDALKEC